MAVIGIGQCSLDYLALAEGYPEIDTKKELLEWHEQCGGPVATALVALSRLGVGCRFYGVTGDDEAGERIRLSLIDEGVDARGLIKREGSSSQKAFIFIEKKTAQRTIFWKRPSGEALRPEDLGVDFLEGCGFLLLDGLMSEVSLYAAEKARSLKIPVMLDAGSVRPGMVGTARLSDYLVASREFAKGMGWDPVPDVLRRQKDKLGVNCLTITLGRQGSITVCQDEVFEVPAFKVDAVDTTGAGDVFHGGYIYGLLKGWQIRDTLKFASAMAALKCTKIGGRAGIPRLHEVKRFFEERSGERLPDSPGA